MSGVRGLVIGDPHFAVNCVREVEQFILKVETAVRRLKPDFIVCLGDLLDRHEIVHLEPLAQATEFCKMLARHAMTFLLIGNHDRRNNSDFMSPLHPFVGLTEHKNLVIVDQVTKYEIVGRNGARANFLFAPYVPPGRLYEALDHLQLAELEEGWRSSSIDALFCHQEFHGVQLGPFASEVGDVWAPDWPLAISGHIHNYHRLQPNLIYVGSSRQIAIDEKPDKALTLFDFNPEPSEEAVYLEEVATLEELRPEPSVRARYVRIDLGLPIKRQLVVTPAEASKFTPNPNETVKLIIKGPSAELKLFQKSGAPARLKAAGVRFATLPQEEKVTAVEPLAATPEKNFLHLFRELVADDKDLSPYFHSLFQDELAHLVSH